MAIKHLGKAATVIVGIEADKQGRRISGSEQVKAHERIQRKYPNITWHDSAGSWVDSHGKIIVENGRTYIIGGVQLLFESEGIAEFIRDQFTQTAAVLIIAGEAYIVE